MSRSAFSRIGSVVLIFLVACASKDKTAEVSCQKLIVEASNTVPAKPVYTMAESWSLTAQAYSTVPVLGCSVPQKQALKQAEQLARKLVPLATRFSALVTREPDGAEIGLVFAKIQPLVEAHAMFRDQQAKKLARLEQE